MAQIVFTLEDGTVIKAELDADLITVGRREDSTVVLSSGSVSGHHATIKRRGDSFFVQDMGSTNGTRLNGVVIEEAKLSHGDQLAFGDILGSVNLLDDVPTVESVAIPVPVPEPVSVPIRAVAEPSVTPLSASAYLPERYSSKPVAKKAPPKPSRPIKQYRSNKSGCVSFVLFVFFLVFALIIGLHVRHAQEHTGRVFFVDVFKRLRGELGKPHEAPPAQNATPPVKKEEAVAPPSM